MYPTSRARGTVGAPYGHGHALFARQLMTGRPVTQNMLSSERLDVSKPPRPPLWDVSMRRKVACLLYTSPSPRDRSLS
eukprot:1925610-Pyramimonas_sp.AAC.1